jgi:hypothetical protein
MVFGTTYCAISHLPINDGDKCILVPLIFEYKINSQMDEEEIQSSFFYLYKFADKSQEVIYKGNPSEIEYCSKKDFKKYELYMLVHYDFYKSIQEKYRLYEVFKPMRFKTVSKIYDIYRNQYEILAIEKAKKDLDNKLISGEEYGKRIFNVEVPDWILEIYKLAMFIDRLGIILYPNYCVDQNEGNQLYEEIRNECINKINLL